MTSIESIETRWRQRLATPGFSRPTLTDRGLVFGAGSILASRNGSHGFDLDRDQDRVVGLLSIVYRGPLAPRFVAAIRKAAAAWDRGDRCLAHIHLGHARLTPLRGQDDAWRLFLAKTLVDAGFDPAALAKTLGIDVPSRTLVRFDPDQPRHPAGSGPESGRWAKAPAAGAAASPSAAPASSKQGFVAPVLAPSLMETLSPAALSWLIRVGTRFSTPAILFGAVFIPDPNPGLITTGALPGQPDVTYRINHDDGTFRLWRTGDADPTSGVLSRLDHGFYRDVETGILIARSLGDGVVLLDPDRFPSLDRRDRSVPETEPSGPGERALAPGDPPKLCPDPGKDQGGGRDAFSNMYEQYVRDHVNPQRQPQLPNGLTFALPSKAARGWTHYDDCRESNGNMIEAKPDNYDFNLRNGLKDKIAKRYLKQAESQFEASGGRHVEWYFHRKENADLARETFKDHGLDQKVSVYNFSYKGKIPARKPRTKKWVA